MSRGAESILRLRRHRSRADNQFRGDTRAEEQTINFEATRAEEQTVKFKVEATQERADSQF